jgi:hypothetical protein
MSTTDPVLPPGDPAPELLDGRLWVDGCFDFFHHGKYLLSLSPVVTVTNSASQAMPAP